LTPLNIACLKQTASYLPIKPAQQFTSFLHFPENLYPGDIIPCKEYPIISQNIENSSFNQQEDRTMKRLFLITIIVMAVVLVGALHGSNVPEERAGDSAGEQVYPGNFPEKLPGIIFDAAVLAPIIR
jgi:hypothetical protein